jgi:hypothetical protein
MISYPKIEKSSQRLALAINDGQTDFVVRFVLIRGSAIDDSGVQNSFRSSGQGSRFSSDPSRPVTVDFGLS